MAYRTLNPFTEQTIQTWHASIVPQCAALFERLVLEAGAPVGVATRSRWGIQRAEPTALVRTAADLSAGLIIDTGEAYSVYKRTGMPK